MTNQPTDQNYKTRNLAVHPSTRLAARVAAAHANTTLRQAVGECLAGTAGRASEVEVSPAPSSDRVLIVAKLHEETWQALDLAREEHGLTWDQLLRAALEVGDAK